MGVEGGGGEMWSCQIGGSSRCAAADVRVVTSDGRSLLAHSYILASASPVLERILIERARKRGSARNVVPILGVPFNAVTVFLRCIYHPRSVDTEEMEKYGVQLLVLGHVMRMQWLKKAAGTALKRTLSVENVVDMMHLARLCDTPQLHVACLNLVYREYADVEKTDGWRFISRNDPRLELEVLKFIEEADMRKKRRKRVKEEQLACTELSEAMECLRHICTEGCGAIRPRGVQSLEGDGQCRWRHACEGLQGIIRHFVACTDRKKDDGAFCGRGCRRCARMWQLLRLHSASCQHTFDCKVPLCREFKLKVETQGKEDGRWELLGRKVAVARLISTLSKNRRLQRVG